MTTLKRYAALVPLIAAVAVGEAQQPDPSPCWTAELTGSFHGSLSTSDVGGRTVVFEQIGTRGMSGVVQRTFGDLRVCLVAEGVGNRNRPGLPSEWLDTAPRFVLEARRNADVQELAGTRGRSTLVRWRVNGRERPFDATGEQWRDRLLDVIDTTWELSSLQGQVSSLRGQISSIRGQQSSLRGQISSLRGQVSSMRGRISSVRGQESSLRGRISSIRGRRDPDADARVAEVEREIRALNADARVAEIESEIRAFDVESKVADVERQIGALDVEGKIAEIERRITALDADRRSAALRERRDKELKLFEETFRAIR